MKRTNSYSVGMKGEELAANFLKENGYHILQRNFRFERGEIDIIATKNKILVFVEVKTAQSKNMGEPETWVTPAKQQQIGKVAQKFLIDFNDESFDCRFDVIGVFLKNDPEITHISNAFWL
ncbi:MAG: YraN family protein [Deferribacteres bacterium]|nr:YraN family protein [candidate division KSB1 bacterium]MCB9501253.1 YraN family protein [Deferribacteres bacterium]